MRTARGAGSWAGKGAGFFPRLKKLEVKYLTAQELEPFPKRFISKSKKSQTNIRNEVKMANYFAFF